ncbi:MAG: diacylglucosamine hydrolase like protein [Arcobacter sp.]|nr:MAG: diacylglucosamine hydrolase like protein [Arcobacter sp.]
MLVHICCAVDSHYFLEEIQKEYPNEKIVGFFYDPNIHPYNEYRLRYLDVEYSCKKLGIELLEGPYNLEEWLKKVKGLENEPEKGDRCTVCFDDRLETTVKKAIELGHDKFTTTLLISPKKSQDKLEKIGAELSSKYPCQFIFKDYRSGQGSQLQGEVVKENSLYRQNYCGCLFGLTAQREQQNKIMDEMFSPISNQILPESIESRLELYKKRDEMEEQNIPYKIIKQRFLNYRLLSGTTKINKKIVPSYFLCYSTLNGKRMNGRIVYEKDEIAYLNRDEVKVLSLEIFNELGNSSYKSVKSLMFNPPTYESELNIRHAITSNPYGLSAIVVVDEVIDGKYEIELNALTYEDVKEVII